MELQQWTRVREESLYAVHLKRRTIGWISGYKIKTKRYFCAATTDKNDSGLHRSSNCDNHVEIPGGMHRSNKCDEAKAMTDDDTCTICLLDLEHGDRIADLQCGHFYHADCLSEWVLKKASATLSHFISLFSFPFVQVYLIFLFLPDWTIKQYSY